MAVKVFDGNTAVPRRSRPATTCDGRFGLNRLVLVRIDRGHAWRLRIRDRSARPGSTGSAPCAAPRCAAWPTPAVQTRCSTRPTWRSAATTSRASHGLPQPAAGRTAVAQARGTAPRHRRIAQRRRRRHPLMQGVQGCRQDRPAGRRPRKYKMAKHFQLDIGRPSALAMPTASPPRPPSTASTSSAPACRRPNSALPPPSPSRAESSRARLPQLQTVDLKVRPIYPRRPPGQRARLPVHVAYRRTHMRPTQAAAVRRPRDRRRQDRARLRRRARRGHASRDKAPASAPRRA